MQYDELVKRISDIIPGAQFDADLDGQIIIYTNLTYNETTREVDDFELPEE